MTGLTAGTLYHVRAYATNLAGTAYGEDVTFTAKAITAITVDCGAGNPVVTAGKSITCVVTVTGSSSAPSGLVTWTSSKGGTFVSNTCSLTPSEGSAATCSVTYTPTEASDSALTHVITASYAGDANYAVGSGNQAVTVKKYPLFLPIIVK
jgi:hypothetical protein